MAKSKKSLVSLKKSLKELNAIVNKAGKNLGVVKSLLKNAEKATKS
ncbi:MAG: hypothetical protein KJ732_04255 [Candidatus Margulisbacteria bacterium]|nr:hypothetical protein [Candidatus Margulisiibacteriota bacterium]